VRRDILQAVLTSFTAFQSPEQSSNPAFTNPAIQQSSKILSSGQEIDPVICRRSNRRWDPISTRATLLMVRSSLRIPRTTTRFTHVLFGRSLLTSWPPSDNEARHPSTSQLRSMPGEHARPLHKGKSPLPHLFRQLTSSPFPSSTAKGWHRPAYGHRLDLARSFYEQAR
jgi:hypothetical protein